jgi:hypothetical protein
VFDEYEDAEIVRLHSLIMDSYSLFLSSKLFDVFT